MGTVYVMLNKTRNEGLYILNCPHKFLELFNKEYAQFVTWLLLDEWRGDHVVFVHDNNSFDYGEEFRKAKDVSDEMAEKWKDFKAEKKDFFEEKGDR